MSRENQAGFAEEQNIAVDSELQNSEIVEEMNEANVEVESSFSNEIGESPELVELRQQVDEAQQRYLRAQADFDNFRKRTRSEKEELAKYAAMPLIQELLPVVDNFERAIAAADGVKDGAAMLKGVEMIFRQLEQVLQNEGLKAMEAVGNPFDPTYHQAVMSVESSDYEEGYVVEELQKGYMLKDKVLRPATVKVSS